MTRIIYLTDFSKASRCKQRMQVYEGHDFFKTIMSSFDAVVSEANYSEMKRMQQENRIIL